MRKLIAAVVVLLFMSVGCRGRDGKSSGIPGTTMREWDGYLVTGDNNIPLYGCPSDADVSVSYALASFPNVWIALGQPSSGKTGNLSAWAAVDLGQHAAYLYNMQAGQLYKIIAISRN